MKLKPYPAYKKSGVDWLGDTPEHWKSFPLKFMASNENTLFIDGDWVESKDLSDSGIRYITTGNIGEGIYKEQGSGYISEDKFIELNCTELLPGDVLISRLNLPIGRACIAPDLGEKVITSVDNVIFRPNNDVNRKFIVYMLSSKEHFANTENLARGTTMQRISRSGLGRIRFLLPSTSEQVCISNFLDHETTKLDTLIAKQERLIALLQEKRQAIISHAVTKGLDPDVPMKDSGIEWLGEVPAHWVVKKLRFVGDAIIGLTYDPSEVTDEEHGTLVLRSSNVQNKQISYEDNVYVNSIIPEKLRTRVGDILICSRNGSRALIGKNALITEQSEGVTFGAFMTVFRSRSNEFLFYVFNSMIFDFQAGSFMTSTVNQLTTGNLYSFEVAMPPQDEQSKIADFLKYETRIIDELIEKTKKSIDLAKDHRSALISAAVTGKIDVREAA